ncbi:MULTISPECIES: exodeoxyribonuclease VII small subunit [Methanohalophilus]|jgi:exodeoxyribonuclease VII small subunit|uniref:Exodeoxyribonuclease VII small subunit n=1 Tax=Methanohalophilus euhalobius TaxID=51203 RepID=A0A285F556_9EURY|nr:MULTISPECIES: exodeoxyribonuclease VII small subunit [Methanohalophilus]KXS40253.1 MAG: exodeoxyribonuclease VII small subunit [Methanohalophilus sp. T328-1]RSD34336.1 MAG: exodeoxyribonuclease VII small subunit [Methanohalophilus sp.]ODV50046.1 MAG: exodeoxyribonuclease VII small subunit [Methanohalophilus sp. 2-GBenrich]PQV43086.1 exodeoxyribonuclease VII small subunit [Methanohalophilus euhalobius]RNI09344.1 exodeoxyribonuclease VII small subunit [Methanohalophilus euhalobius]
MSSNTENKNFEDSLLELEDIVEKLENGQISLQESMEMFERGIKLAGICNNILQESEQRIEQLIEKNEEIETCDLEQQS